MSQMSFPFNSYIQNTKRITELIRLNPIEIFFSGFIPPILSSIIVISIALIFHNEEISNYNWQCGRSRLPSWSRIINLPVERIFWQLFVLFHVPIRGIELITGFVRFERLRNVNYKRMWLYEINRYSYFVFGLMELLFLSGLSIVGERENIQVHVICFYAFGICGIVHMMSNIFCHSHSAYYLNPYGHLSYRLKILYASLFVFSTPILVASFLMYWRKCVTWAYDVFALCEYCGVFLNICFHSCAFFDIRYKVIFSVRKVEKMGKINEMPMKTLMEKY